MMRWELDLDELYVALKVSTDEERMGFIGACEDINLVLGKIYKALKYQQTLQRQRDRSDEGDK